MIRRDIFKGLWYPDCTKELDETVGKICEAGKARNAVLPHAGLFFSAEIIRTFFNTLSSSIKRIVIISPSHYFMTLDDRFTVSSFESAATPYGNIDILPIKTRSSLENDKVIAREHGIEMFLPFIKKKGLDASFLIISHVSEFNAIDKLTDELEDVITENTGVIASSDFTHYGERFGYMPFGKGGDVKVKEFDRMIASLISSFNIKVAYEKARGGTICGLVPALIVSRLSERKGLSGHVGKGYTSNDVLRDHDSSFVSYQSIIWE